MIYGGGIGWSSLLFMIPMVMTGVLGVVGTLAAQWFQSRNAARTTSGSVETSNAGELWAENQRLVDRLTKEIDRLTKDVDHMRDELRRLRHERDEALKAASEMTKKVHELELELQRLKFAQGVAAVTKVTVEQAAPAAEPATSAPEPVEEGGRD